MERIWLKHYPEGVPADIDVSVYPSLVALLEESFRKHAALPAYRFMGKSFSYAQVDELSRAFAAYLQASGLQAGDRVAVMMPNVPQYPVVVAGILRADMVVVNVNPLYTPRELEHQLKDSGAEAIVVLENFASTVAQVVAKTPVKHIVVAAMGDMLGFKGVIVNVSSVSATVASVNRGDYCISKAGVAMATHLWAVRLAEFGIDVFEVRPGIIATDMTSGVKERYDALIADGCFRCKRQHIPIEVPHRQHSDVEPRIEQHDLRAVPLGLAVTSYGHVIRPRNDVRIRHDPTIGIEEARAGHAQFAGGGVRDHLDHRCICGSDVGIRNDAEIRSRHRIRGLRCDTGEYLRERCIPEHFSKRCSRPVRCSRGDTVQLLHNL